MASKIATFAAKKKFKKVMDLLPKATMEEKKEVALACTENKYRETYDILACLIREEDRDLRMQCIKGFTVNGDARAVVHLQWIRNKIGTEDKEMLAAIAEAMANCKETHLA